MKSIQMIKKVITWCRMGWVILVLLGGTPCGFSQGSWNPPGLDGSFPRSFPDSLDVPAVRGAITVPENQDLYNYIWWSATNIIPSGNSTNSDRFGRSLIAREAAYIYLMDWKPVGSTIVALAQSDRDTLLNRVVMLLGSINTDVDVGGYLTFYNPWQNRSKELINYLLAYDLMRGAGVSATILSAGKTRLLTFTANLYQRSMASYTILGLKFFTYQINNHSIMTAAALGLAAVIFNDNSSTNVNYQPSNWINAGLYNLDNTLWIENGTYPRVSEPDTLAGYAEGPNYFKYGFENAFPFIRAMGNFLPDGYYQVTFNSTTRNIRNPWFDERYDRLYDWMNKIRMPDGSVPAIHDSYLGFGTVITALSGKPVYNWVNPGFNANEPMIRTQYLATNILHGAIADSPFQALPAAGSLVFRSSWLTDAVYMHFIGKHGIALTGAKAHHQGDATSFSLSAYGEMMAIDPGYPGSSQAELMNKAVDHSLILVNGAGPLPPSGEQVSTSTNTSYIEHCFDTPLLDYGEVRSNYQGAEISRRNLFVRNKYFLLTDIANASSTKTYAFQLHGNGLYGSAATNPTGVFLPDFGQHGGTYQRSNVKLLTRIHAPGSWPVMSYDTDSMAISGGYRRYSRMLGQKSNVTGTLFLSLLYPYTNSQPVINQGVQRSQVTSMIIQADGYRDLVFSSRTASPVIIPADSGGMNKTVTGNGTINFFSEKTTGIFSSAFIQHGDSLIANNEILIKSNKTMDVVWTAIDTIVRWGYVSDTGSIFLKADHPMQVLSGSLQILSPSPVGGAIFVKALQSGTFILGRDDLTWKWTGMVGSSWHDAGNWCLTGHPDIHGVPAATNNVVIPGLCPNWPVITNTMEAACNNLIIEQNAVLAIAISRALTIHGSLIIH